MNLVERLRLSADKANEDLHVMSKLRDALLLAIEKKDKIITDQYNSIKELNEENDDLVIDMAKLKNDHNKCVDKLLAKIKKLEKASKGADEQKGHDLLIECRGNKGVPKITEKCFEVTNYRSFDFDKVRDFIESLGAEWTVQRLVKGTDLKFLFLCTSNTDEVDIKQYIKANWAVCSFDERPVSEFKPF